MLSLSVQRFRFSSEGAALVSCRIQRIARLVRWSGRLTCKIIKLVLAYFCPAASSISAAIVSGCDMREGDSP
jgi:hypothetical protein